MKVDTCFHPCLNCSLRETCYPLKASYHMTKVLKDNIERQIGSGATANFEVTLKGCPNYQKGEGGEGKCIK